MPEGDAVRRTADLVDRAIGGQVLTASDFRVPQLATSDVTGAEIVATATRGKHLLTRLLLDGTRLTLHTHLKMEGEWRTYRSGARWDRPGHTARVALTTSRAQAVGFALGLVELLPTSEEHTVVGHLGPDLLGDDFEVGEAVRRLQADPDVPLGEALLDQARVAGLGTIYASEACFVHGTSPAGRVGSVDGLERLLDRARRMLQVGVREGRPVTTGDRRAALWVYGRRHQPCRRCGATIETVQAGAAGRERTLWWCPRCQG